MATYTENYNLKKPTYAEPANVKDINDNMEIIDDAMHSTQISLADAYDQNETYNTGDIVMYEMLMYKCKEDNVTGAWNASKWTRTTAAETGGGGSVDFDIFGEGSGSVVTITDGAEAGLAECIVEIEATQSGSGTPSPSNVRPIVGRSEVNVSVSGKNLWDEDYTGISANITYKALYVGDGTFTCSTTCPMSGQAKNIFFISGNVSSGAASATNGVSNGLPITTQSTNGYVTIAYRNDFGLNPTNYDTQIEIGSNATEYVPFVAHNITTIPLDRTVYGGTLDVTRGVLTVTHELVTAPTRGNVDSSGKLYTLVFSPSIGIKSWGQTEAPSTYIASNMFEIEGLSEARASEDKCLVQYGTAIYAGGYIGEESALDTLLATLQIKYELATPQTFNLTPTQVETLLGQYYVSHDGGGTISLVYVKRDAPIKPNPADAEIPLTGLEIGGEKFKIAGGNSEIIPITAGNDTTSRTFTFSKTPKFIKFYWDDTVIEGTGWVMDAQLVWGQAFINYLAHARYTAISSGSGGSAAISYGADGKSITITGGNAFGAMNTSNGTGLMFVEY